jgi:hypothetical protein
MADKKWFEKLSIWQKLKNIKHIEIVIAVIFAIVIFLIYLSSLGSTSSFKNTQATDFETRLSSILQDIDGAGNVSVFVNTGQDNKIVGIIVVASGANQVRVKLDIMRAIQTVLTDPSTNIEILVGNK